jgi:hypothetical protein
MGSILYYMDLSEKKLLFLAEGRRQKKKAVGPPTPRLRRARQRNEEL